MDTKNEKLRDACQTALNTFKKMRNSEYAEIQSKLEFVIGSYNFDKNPVGLYEIGELALKMLNEIEKKNPKKVAKKVVTDLADFLRS